MTLDELQKVLLRSPTSIHDTKALAEYLLPFVNPPVFYQIGPLRIDAVPDPSIPPDEVLFRDHEGRILGRIVNLDPEKS